MKKMMMMIAVVAAMTGIASAAVCVENECSSAGYTAYKTVLTLKTTAAKNGSYKQASACDDTCSCKYYYTQKTMKLAGVIWGEQECTGCTMFGDDLTMLLWNTTTKTPVSGADLTIALGRYEKTGSKVEAYGTVTADDFGEIVIAGFGKMYTQKVQNSPCEEAECYDFVKNISGNAAGYLVREDSDCDAYTFDCCETQYLVDTTAASGTWKITYDATVAKKLAKGSDIATAAKVPSYVDVDADAGTVTIEE